MIKIDADISADWYIVYNTKTNVYMIICRDARYINVALRALCNRLGKNMGCNAKYNWENGEIAAVRIGDEATLKRVYYNGARIILRACNPLYDDLEYEGAQLDEIQVMGKAIAFTSRVR